MARIAGVDLPGNKQVRIALTYIYGIGDPRALKILEKAGIDPMAKMATLDEDQTVRNVFPLALLELLVLADLRAGTLVL